MWEMVQQGMSIGIIDDRITDAYWYEITGRRLAAVFGNAPLPLSFRHVVAQQ